MWQTELGLSLERDEKSRGVQVANKAHLGLTNGCVKSGMRLDERNNRPASTLNHQSREFSAGDGTFLFINYFCDK